VQDGPKSGLHPREEAPVPLALPTGTAEEHPEAGQQTGHGPCVLQNRQISTWCHQWQYSTRVSDPLVGGSDWIRSLIIRFQDLTLDPDLHVFQRKKVILNFINEN